MITTFELLDRLVLYLEETTLNPLGSAENCGLFKIKFYISNNW